MYAFSHDNVQWLSKIYENMKGEHSCSIRFNCSLSLTNHKVKNDVHNQNVHYVIRTRSRIFPVTVIICLKIHIVQCFGVPISLIVYFDPLFRKLVCFCTALTCIVYHLSLQVYMSSPPVSLFFFSVMWSVFVNSVCWCPIFSLLWWIVFVDVLFSLYYGE